MSITRRRALPAWLPLYLLCVLAATLSPLLWSSVPRPFSTVPLARDLVQNVVALLPLGFGLRHRPRYVVLLSALVLSGSVELLQRHLGRTPSPWDVATNVCGAWLGAQWRRAPALHARLRARLPWLALPLLVALAYALQVMHARAAALPANDFSNWQVFPALIGAEEPLESRWAGVLKELRVYDRVLESPEGLTDDGLVLALRFGPESRAELRSPPRTLPLSPPRAQGFVVTRDGLVLGPGRFVLPTEIAAHLRHALMRTGRMSLYARLSPAPEPDSADRRIFALSLGWMRRNFSLGQREGQLYFRVRTPLAGPSGGETVCPLPATPGPLLVLASAGPWHTRLQVGDDYVTAYAPTAIAWFPLGQGIVLTRVLVVSLAGLALCLLLRRRRLRLIALTAGCVLGHFALAATGLPARHADTFVAAWLPELLAWLACVPLVRAQGATELQ